MEKMQQAIPRVHRAVSRTHGTEVPAQNCARICATTVFWRVCCNEKGKGTPHLVDNHDGKQASHREEGVREPQKNHEATTLHPPDPRAAVSLLQPEHGACNKDAGDNGVQHKYEHVGEPGERHRCKANADHAFDAAAKTVILPHKSAVVNQDEAFTEGKCKGRNEDG